MVCQNICQRLYATTQTSGHYSAGAKYRRQFEYYLITTELFVIICGMRLRGSPSQENIKKKLELRKIEG
jgi:hypothetical protein